MVNRINELHVPGINIRTLDGLLNTAGIKESLRGFLIGFLPGLAEVERSLFQ